MDGDGQHLPQDIPKLLESIDRFDMVIGARNFREILEGIWPIGFIIYLPAM
jgi:hypothetical protein